MPGGRPPLFTSEEALSALIDTYFQKETEFGAWVEINGNKEFRPTMSGLALHLGMTRQSLCNYANNEQFFDTIKKARLRIETALEGRLWDGAPVGTIFNLKNNFGWKDQQQLDVNRNYQDMDDEELTQTIKRMERQLEQSTED